MNDGFRYDAGPYVLGALTPAERRRFHAHLRRCPDCADSVRDFAPLPTLLASVPLRTIRHDGAGCTGGGPAAPAARRRYRPVLHLVLLIAAIIVVAAVLIVAWHLRLGVFGFRGRW